MNQAKTGVNNLSEREKQIFQMAEPYLASGGNVDHTYDMLSFAWKLLHRVKGDRDIVIPAVILHDVGWGVLPAEAQDKTRVPNANRRLLRTYEEEGGRIARRILGDVGSEAHHIVEIVQIIDGHDSRREALSINDKIVKDADKLSKYSACFRPIYERAGISPQELCGFLESKTNQWLFIPASKKLAEAELVKRKRESAQSLS